MLNVADMAKELFPSLDTRDKVLRAAMVRFLSYGFKRTSVEDIAVEANVSRPTLYAYFKNKEELLRKVSETIHEDVLVSITGLLQSDRAIEDRLRESFREWSRPFMEILFGSAHGAELIGASSAIASSVFLHSMERFKVLLAQALKQAQMSGELHFEKTGLTPKKAAELLILSLNGLTNSEATERQHNERINALIKIFLISSGWRSKNDR